MLPQLWRLQRLPGLAFGHLGPLCYNPNLPSPSSRPWRESRGQPSAIEEGALSEAARMWVQVSFRIAYLIIVWSLVMVMTRQAGRVAPSVGILILTSYALYVPVILFVQQAPLIGLLMIPKTTPYVAIGFIAYLKLYRPGRVSQGTKTVSGAHSELAR
jgi:hypothetical protein